MDNSGAAMGNTRGENLGNAAANPFEAGNINNFEAFQKSNEVLPNVAERPGEVITSPEENETKPETVPLIAPPVTQTPSTQAGNQNTAPTDNSLLVELENTPVPEDAKKIPRAYMNTVVKIINKDKKDPHQLVADLDVARWDMMKKAFRRKRGDGYSGRR